MMIVCLLVTLAVGATGSKSSSSSHLWRGQSDGATTAVLSATGDAFIVRSARSSRDAEKATSGEARETTPECTAVCDNYYNGVDKDTQAVCMRSDGSCDHPGRCVLAGDGQGATDPVCVQRLHDECTDHCSEWGADTNESAINVCQHSTDKHKCLSRQAADSCPTDYSMCRQKPIDKCIPTCGGFSGALNKESEIVCMIMGGDNMGFCMPLPCSADNLGYAAHAKTVVCKQTYDDCDNLCAAGSDHAPPGTPTCFDGTDETCHEVEDCEAQGWTRCISINFHQNLSNVDRQNDSEADPEWFNPPLNEMEKSGMEAQQKGGKMMRQHRSMAQVG